ncbi:hypothetical protein D1007_43413 [Hordeum vulgare]|nr:hypothetical protein D1007_43413 [Hordeum vulgare]
MAREPWDSSIHPSVEQDGFTATSSSPQVRLEHVDAQGASLMARELLHYCLADTGYDAWLGRITELVIVAGEAPTPSNFHRLVPTRIGDVAHRAALPPPLHADPAKP